MNPFFQKMKELSWGNCLTITGIDDCLAGEKVLVKEGTVEFKTEGFPEESIQNILASQTFGVVNTQMGRVFVESLTSTKRLVICGGGHVSCATLSIGKMLGFHVNVVEDRPEFAGFVTAAGADRVICDEFVKGLGQIDFDEDTYVVIMTRGHRHDLDCLKYLLDKPIAYLGMMGSKRRVKMTREQLLELGFSMDQIESLHAPIGLSIKAETPAEIAVSVMGEIISEKNRTKSTGGYEENVAQWLMTYAGEVPAVLATIIGRKGSAPRQVGTKMIVLTDGSSIGTIGGGCMEAEVKTKARHLMTKNPEQKCETCFVDMTIMEAEDAGMVCGGTLEILLERITE